MKYLSSFLIAISIFGCDKSRPEHAALLGVWQSNEAMTLASMKQVEDINPSVQAFLENDFFGQLKIEYRESEVRAVNKHYDFDTGFQPYTVVEVTKEYIRVREVEEYLGVDQETTLHLEGDCYYVIITKYRFREYFCRVE